MIFEIFPVGWRGGGLEVEHEIFPPLELSTNTGIFMSSCWVLFVEISLFIPLCLLIKSVVPRTNLLLTTNAGAQRTNWQHWQCQSQQTHQVPLAAPEVWEITTTMQPQHTTTKLNNYFFQLNNTTLSLHSLRLSVSYFKSVKLRNCLVSFFGVVVRHCKTCKTKNLLRFLC